MVCLLKGPWTDLSPLSTWEVGKFKRNIVIYCKTYCFLIHLQESESSILRWPNAWSSCSKDHELTHLLYLLRRWVSSSTASSFILKLLLSDPSPRSDPPPLSTWEVGKFKRNIEIYCKTYCFLIHLQESESSILRWPNSWSSCSKDHELTHLLYLLRRWVSSSAAL